VGQVKRRVESSAGAGAQLVCHVIPPSVLRQTSTFDVVALSTTEWKTDESPMQIEDVAQESVMICAFDQPGDPSNAFDQGSTLEVHVIPPSSVRMMTVR
jgi:hypothetical protein